MTAGSIERSLAACQAWLAAQDAPERVVVAHEAGVARSGEDAGRWIQRTLAEQNAAGAWGDDLLATATALIMIQDLREAAGLAEQDPSVGRGLDWIRATRGRPGSWTDGCTPGRHDAGLCHHFAGGWFSPGPPDQVVEEARLPSGARIAGDPEVRFVASATALRCLLRWVQPGPDARLHLASLRRLVEIWEEGRPEGLSTGALLAAVHALVTSDADADRHAAGVGLRLIASRQRGDGSWVETDAFQAMDVITAADRAGVEPTRARRALWHGARLLVASQQADGSWGQDHGARRALIAWRTLRRVESSPEEK